MSPLKRLQAVMIGRLKEESPPKLKESRKETLLLEQDSGVGVGSLEKDDTMSKMLLIESAPVNMVLVEGKGNKLIARGEFGRVGVATRNGRIYPEEIILREIDRLEEDISNRRVLGELDHPTDGKTSLKRVSHVLTGLKVKDGIIIGETEILNTPEGKTLKALIEANVQLGVSSRGYGSTKPSTDPKMEGDVVQEDFVLKTWDFVADPAVRTALPTIYQEDVEQDALSAADMFIAEFPDVAKKIQEDAVATANVSSPEPAEESAIEKLSEQFEKRFAQSLLEAREEISNDLREEFENDPEIGGARATLEAILEMALQFRATPDEKALADAAKAKDIEVSEAVELSAELSARAVQAEALLAAERKIAGHPMAESVRGLLSKQTFESVEDGEEAVETILKDLPDRGEIITREESELRENNTKLGYKVSLLEEKADALTVKLQKAALLGKEADTQLDDIESQLLEAKEALSASEAEKVEMAEEVELTKYKYNKVVGMANGRKMLSLMEDVSSKEQVDALVTGRGVQDVSKSALSEMRNQLRKGKGDRPGREELHEEESVNQGRTDELGNDMSNMRRLAGLNLE